MFVFNGKKTAGKAFGALEDHMPAYPWIEDAAVESGRTNRVNGGHHYSLRIEDSPQFTAESFKF